MLEIKQCEHEGMEIYFAGTYRGKPFELTYHNVTGRWFWINEGETELTRIEIRHKVIPELEERLQ